MHTVTLVQTKGGVGKTTLTTITAYAVANQGVKVAVCDLDPRRDTTVWLTKHPYDGIILQPDFNSPLPDDVAFRLIDTEGSLGVIETLKGYPQSDLYIIPVIPEALAINGAALTIEKLRKVFPTATMLLVWNSVQGGRADSDPEVLSELTESLGVPAMSAQVGKFSCNSRAMLSGWKTISSAKAEQREQWKTLSTQIMSRLLGIK